MHDISYCYVFHSPYVPLVPLTRIFLSHGAGIGMASMGGVLGGMAGNGWHGGPEGKCGRHTDHWHEDFYPAKPGGSD
jgi:hypothetical protein